MTRDTSVSIRAPAWGRTAFCDAWDNRRQTFQSAPPRGDERFPGPARVSLKRVSIRAPAWGRTRRAGHDRRGCVRVSIRAPAWGRTENFDAPLATGRFQSAPPRGDERRCCNSIREQRLRSTFREPAENNKAGGPKGCLAGTQAIGRRCVTTIANLPENPCALDLRVRRSVGHRCHGQGPHHGVRHAFRGLSRGSKTSRCRPPGR